MKDFADFLAKLDNPQHRSRTEEVLGWVADKYPNLAQEFKWNQPMFTDHGTFIIGFSVAKHHLAVAPEAVTIRRFSDDIGAAGYEHSKQLVRIPWESAVDFSLLEKIIEFNVADKADCSTFWRK